ncbi:MAG: TetR/AcrR family transcriptional regulator [Myxococcales bacterium]|nr:TetR/AcrR family transcriptional regulator [Myxococcales bacterium]MCB9735029.1 TetR/AcrR family transcriptional regulator [Deltaproteobacteria bacterium]
MNDDERPLRRSYKPADERRQMLVDHGVALFSDATYEEVSIDDIAARAGVSKGLLYHYFRGKRDLYLEVVRAVCAELERTLSLDRSVPRFDNMRQGLIAFLEFARRRRRAYRSLLSGSNDAEVLALLDRTRDTLAQRLLDGLELTEPVPAPYRMAARACIGAIEAAASDWLEHDDVPAEQTVQLIMAGFLGNLLVARHVVPHGSASLDLSEGLRRFGALFAREPASAGRRDE